MCVFLGFATEALGVTNEVWGVRPVRAVTLMCDSSHLFRCRQASQFPPAPRAARRGFRCSKQVTPSTFHSREKTQPNKIWPLHRPYICVIYLHSFQENWCFGKQIAASPSLVSLLKGCCPPGRNWPAAPGIADAHLRSVCLTTVCLPPFLGGAASC